MYAYCILQRQHKPHLQTCSITRVLKDPAAMQKKNTSTTSQKENNIGRMLTKTSKMVPVLWKNAEVGNSAMGL